MDLLEEHAICCPYCGEELTVNIDCSAGSHDFIEDCAVCCSPIELRAKVDSNRLVALQVRRDDE